MKKFFALVIAALMIVSFCGCGTSEKATQTSEETPVLSDAVLSENPMFVKMGYYITIDGVTYGASQIDATKEGANQIINQGYFVVNKVNRKVYYVYGNYQGSNRVGQAIDTGLYYYDAIIQDGIVVAPAYDAKP